MTFVAMMVVIDFNLLRWWYLVTAGCFGLLVLRAAFFGIITGGQFTVYGPPGSMVGDNNDFALAINMVLPTFWYLGGAEKVPLVRATLRFTALCGVISVILTYSRGGLLGLAAVLMAMGLKSRHKVAAAAGVVTIGLLVLELTPHAWIGRMATIRGAAQTDPSAMQRLRSWGFAARLAKDHPLMGGGFDTFTDNLAVRYSVEGELHGPHSIYFQMLAEQGFTGLILYTTLLFSSVWACRNLNRRFKRDHSAPWIADYASMIQVGLIGYAVNGAFLGRAYFDLFFQLVATVIILQFLARCELTRRSDEILEFTVASSRNDEVSSLITVKG
jgi:putative inorganic carbon (HCO3(-)) transporter